MAQSGNLFLGGKDFAAQTALQALGQTRLSAASRITCNNFFLMGANIFRIGNAQCISIYIPSKYISTGNNRGEGCIVLHITTKDQAFYITGNGGCTADPRSVSNHLEAICSACLQLQRHRADGRAFYIQHELVCLGIPTIEITGQECTGSQRIYLRNFIQRSIPNIGSIVIVLTVLQLQIVCLITSVIKNNVFKSYIKGNLVNLKTIDHIISLDHCVSGPCQSRTAADPSVGIDICPVSGVDEVNINGNKAAPGANAIFITVTGGRNFFLSYENFAAEGALHTCSQAGGSTSSGNSGNFLFLMAANVFRISNTQLGGCQIPCKHICTGNDRSNGCIIINTGKGESLHTTLNGGSGAKPVAIVDNLKLILGVFSQIQEHIGNRVSLFISTENIGSGVPAVKGACQSYICGQQVNAGHIFQRCIPDVSLMIKVLTGIQLQVGSLAAAAIVENNIFKSSCKGD